MRSAEDVARSVMNAAYDEFGVHGAEARIITRDRLETLDTLERYACEAAHEAGAVIPKSVDFEAALERLRAELAGGETTDGT